MRLKGKRIVVTGAASGIGRATTLLFIAEGAEVFAIDRDETKLQDLIEVYPTAIQPYAADCGDEAAMEAAFRAATAEERTLDAVFANAGTTLGNIPFLEQTGQHWDAVLKTNLLGAFYSVKYGARAMMHQGYGSIICTASVAGLRANAAGAPYSASKAGVINLVQTAANALSGSGIRVNAICPGLIETSMTQSIFEAARARGSEDRIGQLNPLKRPGKPEEVASAALFLASDESSYINGQIIVIDGGLSSTHPFQKGADRF